MATLKITEFFEIDGNPSVKGGDLSTPIEITVSGQTFHVENKTIADNFGEDVLWTTGEGGLDTFGHLRILSTADLFVEFRTDTGTPEFIITQIAANVPTWLSSDDLLGGTATKFDGAVLVEGTDYDQIDRIEVHNDAAEGVGDAVVDLWLFG